MILAALTASPTERNTMTAARYQYKIFVNGRREPELFETTEPTTLGAARMYADVLGLNQWRSRVERHDHIVFDDGTRIVASPHIEHSMTLRLPS
jgi:hypothetical protein